MKNKGSWCDFSTVTQPNHSRKGIYFFFDLAPRLVAFLAFFDLAVFLPDLHPHVWHICRPFQKR